MGKMVIDVPKNSFEIIRVQPTKFKGYRLADIRVFYREGEGDEYKPSPKGLSVRLSVLPKLLSAIKELAEAEGCTEDDGDVSGQ